MVNCNRLSCQLLMVFAFFAWTSSYGQRYLGKPFTDSLHYDIQTIPGRLQCAQYDIGGEGIAYHDTDSVNQGSGKLNPADGTYLNEFRMREGVDISYTKFREPPIDNNVYNLVMPSKDQLYVGWTSPGEWIKYTVFVKETGTYTLGMMYTASQGGKISISVNDIDATGLVEMPSTYVKDDSIHWRQWHHWNYLKDFAKVKLDKGIQIITLSTRETGQMNYSYIDFTPVKENVGQDSSIPLSIGVPKRSRLIWHTYAKGVQVYVCTQDTKDTSNFIWTFKEPRANLYADSSYRQLVGQHYFDAGKNPTWETSDGSKVSGVKVEQANSPDSASIPWLLLHATVTGGKGTLTRAAFIQRIHTRGGKAPATAGRLNKGQSLEVGYTAEYFFYTEK